MKSKNPSTTSSSSREDLMKGCLKDDCKIDSRSGIRARSQDPWDHNYSISCGPISMLPSSQLSSMDGINDDEEAVRDDNTSVVWRRGIENLRRLVSRRRLSRRLLVLSIRHDYVSRLRRAFLAMRTRGFKALSMAVQRYEDARSWRRSRLLAMTYGLWVVFVQDEKQKLLLSVTAGVALFRCKSLRRYFLRLQLAHQINEDHRRKVFLSESYSAFLRQHEGLCLLKSRTAERRHLRHHLVKKLESSKPRYLQRRLAAVLHWWSLKHRLSTARSDAHALAMHTNQQRSLALALPSWQLFVADRRHRQVRFAYAAHDLRDRQLVAAVGRWQRGRQQSVAQTRTMQVAVQHDGFLGTYRRCIKVLVKLVALMKRSLLRRRKVSVSDKAHRRHVVRRGWLQVRAYRAAQRTHAATILKADFHRDMRRLSSNFRQLQHNQSSGRDSKHALLKGVLIWKMTRLLTGVRRWHQWTLRKVRRRGMRLAARVGHAAEVATRACRMLFTVAAAVGGRNASDRRRKLIVMTIKQWKRVTLRGQLEREKMRQRALWATALDKSRALSRGTAIVGHSTETTVGSGVAAGSTSNDITGMPVPDLLKAKPRPLAPFLVFQSSGSGIAGSSLTCALGTTDNLYLVQPTGIPSTSPAGASSARVPAQYSSSSSSSFPQTAGGAVSGEASASPWSSPVSVASIGSDRFLSHNGDHKQNHSHSLLRSQPHLQGEDPGGADTRQGRGGDTGSGSGGSGLGLARALPRKSSLLGCSLFHGLPAASAASADFACGAGAYVQSWSGNTHATTIPPPSQHT